MPVFLFFSRLAQFSKVPLFIARPLPFLFFFHLSSFTIAVSILVFSVAVTMQVFYIPLSVVLFISLYHVLCNF